jgi:epoxyqueuosine reductase QueG
VKNAAAGDVAAGDVAVKDAIIKDEIIHRIGSALRDYEKRRGLEGFWKEPLTAFLSAADPRLPGLKKSVSPGHLLPGEVLPGAGGIVCFFIPFQDRIVEGNTAAGRCSREWAAAYIHTNDLIARIGDEIGALMAEKGFSTGKIKATHNFNEQTLISDWSHRHIACLAGLGSFGLNNMLITGAGCCGRVGSVVTGWGPVPSPEPFRERCLHRLRGGCGLCRTRCPAGAYRGGGFDRRACYAQCLMNAGIYRDLGLADVCGKCLTALPCSTRDPSVQ